MDTLWSHLKVLQLVLQWEWSAIGLELFDSSMGFSGLCRGITRRTFQMFGILALFTKKFMVLERYLSAMGLDVVSGLALFYLGPWLYFSLCLISSFTVLRTFCLLFPVSYLFLVYFLSVFHFSPWWSVLLVKLVAAFPWIMASSFLSVKLYGSVCSWLSVTWQKFFSSAPEFTAVTSFSKFLYQLDPLFLLLTFNRFVFIPCFSCVILGSLDVFFEFHLFSESFSASLGKLATTFVGYACQPLNLWLSLMSFPRGRHLLFLQF